MMISDVQKQISLPELFKSLAFASAEEKWRFESWDDKQWEKVIKAAIAERDHGIVPKRRKPTRHT